MTVDGGAIVGSELRLKARDIQRELHEHELLRVFEKRKVAERVVAADAEYDGIGRFVGVVQLACHDIRTDRSVDRPEIDRSVSRELDKVAVNRPAVPADIGAVVENAVTAQDRL
jgi:hypothetical protein